LHYSIIGREFCYDFRIHLVIPELTSSRITKFRVDFESLQGISLVLDAINRNHISINVPNVNPKSYYYKIDEKVRKKKNLLQIQL
jgi:hypothetical protein